MDNEEVESVSDVKYLGIELEEKSNFKNIVGTGTSSVYLRQGYGRIRRKDVSEHNLVLRLSSYATGCSSAQTLL